MTSGGPFSSKMCLISGPFENWVSCADTGMRDDAFQRGERQCRGHVQALASDPPESGSHTRQLAAQGTEPLGPLLASLHRKCGDGYAMLLRRLEILRKMCRVLRLAPCRCPTDYSDWFCCRSVAQSWPTLCSPVNCSTTGFPILHNLPEFAQTLVY